MAPITTRPVLSRKGCHNTTRFGTAKWGFLNFIPMDFKKASGKRLRVARKDKGITLEQLSKALKGVLSASRLGNYEQGTRAMGPEEALALSQILGVQPAYLLCVDTEDGDMTTEETELLRNFRALPERDRADYSRRISVLALAYKEPVPDEKLSSAWKAPKKTKKPSAPQQ
jgi:transcriptional regulator with XRE-family HTH domain